MRWRRTLSVVDCHAEGESGKVVVGGIGHVPGETMFDKRIHFSEHMDDIRKLLLFEPRGAAGHNANVILPSNNPKADIGYLILESTEYPAMSGSNTICVATVLLETGILPMEEPETELVLEAPAGLIRVNCRCKDGKVERVRFLNQPAFCYYLDARIDVPDIGSLTVDVAYGGMTYVLVDAAALGYRLVLEEARRLCELGQIIKAAAAEQLRVTHPIDDRIPGITQTLFAGPLATGSGCITSRNAVVVSPGRMDRSPCGTGCSARLAVLHAKGILKPGDLFVHESIIGSRFDCLVAETTKVGRYPAIVPSVAGQAWITGLYQMGMDPTDPYQSGFTLSDTWLQALS